MNIHYETPVRAFNRVTKEWKVSGISFPGKNGISKYFRVDAIAPEKLEDFDCYEIADYSYNREAKTETFRVVKKLNLKPIYS
jgi:hypothetical protein